MTCAHISQQGETMFVPETKNERPAVLPFFCLGGIYS